MSIRDRIREQARHSGGGGGGNFGPRTEFLKFKQGKNIFRLYAFPAEEEGDELVEWITNRTHWRAGRMQTCPGYTQCESCNEAHELYEKAKELEQVDAESAKKIKEAAGGKRAKTRYTFCAVDMGGEKVAAGMLETPTTVGQRIINALAKTAGWMEEAQPDADDENFDAFMELVERGATNCFGNEGIDLYVNCDMQVKPTERYVTVQFMPEQGQTLGIEEVPCIPAILQRIRNSRK